MLIKWHFSQTLKVFKVISRYYVYLTFILLHIYPSGNDNQTMMDPLPFPNASQQTPDADQIALFSNIESLQGYKQMLYFSYFYTLIFGKRP